MAFVADVGLTRLAGINTGRFGVFSGSLVAQPAAVQRPPGSDELFDAVVAWGEIQAVRKRTDELFAAGADQVVLNLITKDRSVPYIPELRALASLNNPAAS